MQANNFKKIVDLVGIENIDHISTTSLLTMYTSRVKEGTFVIHEADEVFSYVDNINNQRVIIDINDVNKIVLIHENDYE